MTKFGAPFVAQTSAAGRLGAVFFLALGVFVACGNDTPQVTPGGGAGQSGRGNSSAGRPGNAGQGHGAEAGQDDAAGTTGESGSAGEGSVEMGGSSGKGGAGGTGPGTGGSSGKGGTGTGGSSGSGGKGGAGPVCGNNVLETGEVCDDGNTVFGDSCSPKCTNICELCESNLCTFDYGYTSCDEFDPADGTATSGPGTGKKRRALCKSLVTCYQRTGCAKSPDVNSAFKDCYCGTASSAACQSNLDAPNGACRNEIEEASEAGTNVYNTILARFVDGFYPIGAASNFYLGCDRGLCSNECVLGKPQTACQTCAGLNFTETMAACYASPTTDPAGLCSAAMQCAHQTNCALNGAASCYGVVTGSGANSVLSAPGPCANEIAQAANGKNPAEIASSIANFGGELLVAKELASETAYCKAACFPPPGAGGGAGGSSGNGGSVNGGTGG